ncbi:M20 family metallopeptidase [Rhodococcus sp. NPDC077669]|uniref:M20 family metallopeptidase n=1 Tax=Rhodococcus sp. NPDC077669 TaxID=3155174 RepID=UPI0034277B43
MNREHVIAQAKDFYDSGAFHRELSELVSVPSESQSTAGRVALSAYLQDLLVSRLEALGCAVETYSNPVEEGGPFLIATRHEAPELPTVLCYGHADVVLGMAEDWSDGLSPWTLVERDGRLYGRGTADNKGQHLVNLAALRTVLDARGSLGFNLTLLFETGEEIGSPGLEQFVSDHRGELAADVLIASDGPRLDAQTPTLFLGARGGVDFDLVDLRERGYHSGNWGGLLRNPATTLAGAIGTLVDGHGRIQLDGLVPERIPESVVDALRAIEVGRTPGDPVVDSGWSATELSPAERVFGWNTLEVIAMSAGNIVEPVNAIPGQARARLQLRYVVGTDLDDLGARLRRHLDAHGYSMVAVELGISFPASRTDPNDPWVRTVAQSVERTVGSPVTVLPNIGGSLPNHVFTDTLGIPTVWMPHSYPGCRQHAPDEHMLASVAREGLAMATGLFFDLGAGTDDDRDAPLESASASRS